MIRPDRVIERLFIKGDFVLESPLLIGCGVNQDTDIDVIRDFEGLPYCPGTSLTGALRSFLAGGKKIREEPATVKRLFGAHGKDGVLSPLSVHDAFPVGELSVSRRDGVRLTTITRTAASAAKYDYEVVETGSTFVMRFEMVFRAKDNKNIADLKHEIFLMLRALENGEIRIGARTRRGFGRGRFKNAVILNLVFDESQPTDPATIEQWVAFDWRGFQGNASVDSLENKSGRKLSHTCMSIKATFKLPGGLLIRGSGEAMLSGDSPDSQQLRSAAGWIVPGTSWAGCLRHQMSSICSRIGMPPLNSDAEPGNKGFEVLQDLFGYVDKDRKRQRASRITIEESVGENGLALHRARNKIDRFTGGTVTGALFDELPICNADLARITLAIGLENAQDHEIGLLLLAIQDMGNGLQPIGGTVAIGRGLLEGQTIEINRECLNFEDENWQKYMQALYQYLKKTEPASEKETQGGVPCSK